MNKKYAPAAAGAYFLSPEGEDCGINSEYNNKRKDIISAVPQRGWLHSFVKTAEYIYSVTQRKKISILFQHFIKKSQLFEKEREYGTETEFKRSEFMKRVLWISRHEMTAPQLRDLERVLGDKVELECQRDTICDMNELRPLIAASDAVAAVLPPRLLAELMAMRGERPVLQSVSARRQSGRMNLLPDGRREPEVIFEHLCWEQVLQMELETRRL